MMPGGPPPFPPTFDDVIRFIRGPSPAAAGVPAAAGAAASTFEAMALRVFAYQFEHNRLYRAYCESRAATPDTVTRWDAIPAVPTRVFQCVDLVCGAPERLFLSSGTTAGPQKRSRHGFPDLALYDASALMNFADSLLPDLAAPSPPPLPTGARVPTLADGRILTCALMPSSTHRPDSSLSYMIDLVIRTFGSQGSGWYTKEGGLDLPSLTAALRHATDAGRPVLLLGPTAGFAHFFEACRTEGLRFALPAGSRVMDTGGTKGIQGQVFSRDAFFAACADLLGIPAGWCVNEYGMTEMGSQFYDHVLLSRHRGLPPRPRYKTIPHWVRTRILDPETLDPVRSGTVGILCHYDLANAGSVMAVLTEDLGVNVGNGFEVVGRATGSEARGCSLALDEFLARTGAPDTPGTTSSRR